MTGERGCGIARGWDVVTEVDIGADQLPKVSHESLDNCLAEHSPTGPGLVVDRCLDGPGDYLGGDCFGYLWHFVAVLSEEFQLWLQHDRGC